MSQRFIIIQYIGSIVFYYTDLGIDGENEYDGATEFNFLVWGISKASRKF